MQVKDRLRSLAQAYKLLADTNRNFVARNSGIDGFRNLVEQRNMIIEDIELIGRELVSETEATFRGNSFLCQNLTEVLRALPVLAPDLAIDCETIKEELRNLVESDQIVEEFIGKFRDDLKGEIGRIRKNSRSLKGYRQNESLGSCFINKVK